MSEIKAKKISRVHKPDFKIFQFVKLDGIRMQKKPENLTRFISPIFGSSVPDELVIPKTTNLGDNKKRLDAFRDKPSLSDAEIKSKNGTEYPEFDIINNSFRKEYLGGKIVNDGKEKPVFKEEERQSIKPIFIKEEKQEEIPFKVIEKPRNIVLEPVLSEPEISKFKSSEIVSEDFDDKVIEEKPVELKKEVVKPVIQREIKINKSDYRLPPISLFKKINRNRLEKPEWLLEQIDLIDRTLTDFGIEAKVIGSTKGPTVTRYELALEPGVNVSRINSISDNLMMNLKAKSLRILAPIPGKPYVGLEVPNVDPEIVAFGNVVDDRKFLESHDKPLLVALGEDIDGNNVYVDIAKMPHGLIAGATNSGKSVCINTVLASLLIKNRPEELKLILVDPKMVELNAYNDLPHLITPVITDAKMASQGLKWAVNEMERRYKIFANNRSRDIKSFNENIKTGRIEEEIMPYIVIVIDELADLMMAAASDVEDSIQRLTQKARAAGIHLIVATQRPTTDVVKGTIKSNIPSRIAFKVASYVDSTTILDGAGAESLLGKGDMLLKEVDLPKRLQGAFLPDDEIYALTDYIREQKDAEYVLNHEDLKQRATENFDEKDPLFNDVAYFVVESNTASINRITQEFKISFNRAQMIVKMLESYQIVSESQGTKAREVLVTLEDLESILENVY